VGGQAVDFFPVDRRLPQQCQLRGSTLTGPGQRALESGSRAHTGYAWPWEGRAESVQATEPLKSLAD
jgi:hypothetical protein